MKFNIFRPNATINSQGLNNTQMTNSFNNLSHWCLHKVQENEKRKNMTGALVRNGLNTLYLECFWKSNYRKTRWNRHVASNSYIADNSNPVPIRFSVANKRFSVGRSMSWRSEGHFWAPRWSTKDAYFYFQEVKNGEN